MNVNDMCPISPVDWALGHLRPECGESGLAEAKPVSVAKCRLWMIGLCGESSVHDDEALDLLYDCGHQLVEYLVLLKLN